MASRLTTRSARKAPGTDDVAERSAHRKTFGDVTSAGICLTLSLSLLIAVPILQTQLVGRLSQVVPAAIVLLTVFCAITREIAIPWPPVVMLVTYAVVCGTSTLIAPDPGGPLNLLVHLAIGAAAFLMGIACNRADRILVVRSIVLLAAAESAHAIGESLGIFGPLWGYHKFFENSPPEALISELFEGVVRGQGSLGHPLLLSFLAVVGIGLIIGVRPFRSGTVRVALGVLLFAGILAAGSRSGVIIALLLILLSFRKLSTRILIGTWLAAVSITTLTLVGFWSSSVVERFLESNSLSHRSSSVGSTVSVLTDQNILEVLFGNGLLSTKRLYLTGVLPYAGDFYAVDNQYVSTLVVSGFVGLVCVLGVMAWSWSKGGRQYRWALMAAFLMFLTFEVLLCPSSVALTLALMGMALSDRQTKPESLTQPPYLENSM